jgi:hypothetical protein
MIACCWTMQAEEKDRLPRGLSINDLTDPKSPSYIPIPFPKTKAGITEDLMYQLSKLYSQEDSWEIRSRSTKNLLYELVQENPDVKIVDIIKIKNRMSAFPSEYSYVIIIKDTKNRFISRLGMRACGMIACWQNPSERNPGRKLLKDEEVLERLSKYHKAASKKENVKKIDRVAYDITYAPPSHPVYEITMNDGSTYFVNHRDHVFKKISEKKVKGDKRSALIAENNKIKADKTKQRRGDRNFLDAPNNKIIYLKRLTDDDLD